MLVSVFAHADIGRVRSTCTHVAMVWGGNAPAKRTSMNAMQIEVGCWGFGWSSSMMKAADAVGIFV